eukprot:12099625-Alexandrium_andersonii.AAC.1
MPGEWRAHLGLMRTHTPRQLLCAWLAPRSGSRPAWVWPGLSWLEAHHSAVLGTDAPQHHPRSPGPAPPSAAAS